MKHNLYRAIVALVALLTLMTVQISQSRAQVRGTGAPRPATALPNATAANFVRGQIVHFNPQTNMFTLRTGAGAAAREQQFRFDKDTRFFDPDRRAIGDAMRFDGFRNGADVWFRRGSGERAEFIHDMRLFDPDEPVLRGNVRRGEIVDVDRANGMITIRSGEGSEASERKFHIDRRTRFFDRDRLALENGLAFEGFASGVPIWFSPGAGGLAETLAGVSLSNPVVATADSTPAGPAAPSRFARGIVVKTDPKANTLTVTLGEGTEERRIDLNVSFDARFFGADRRPLGAGLAFRGFRPGADVWFQTTTGDLTGAVTAVSLADPMLSAGPAAPPGAASSAQPSSPEPKPVISKYVTGRVVAVDANDQTITVKTGVGDDAREHTYKVVIDTLFFGPQREPIQEGLRYQGLRPGVDVWLRVGTGELANTVRDLRMHDPSRSDKDH